MKFLSTFLLACSLASAASTHWIATWSASPAPQLADEAARSKAHLQYDNQTLREIVHVSLGGERVRLRLSNAFGKQTAELGAVHLALRDKASAIVAGSDHALTFSGRPSVSIPPNAIVLSDPIILKVPSEADLVISIYIPKPTSGAGVHYAAEQTSYIGAGDLTTAPSLPNPQTITSWVFLGGVDVLAPETDSTIVTFGDSITDGARSTPDANRRWPNVLASRLLAEHGHKFAVVDAGIGGNRVLHDAQTNVGFGINALARFDRDVLAQPGVKYVIVLEGINDLGHAGSSAPISETVSAEDLIAGLQQFIERGHEKGLKIIGATLTPFDGTVFPGYFSPEKEVKRKTINQWIRSSHAFDGVIDFDKAVRDPANPDRISPAYDSGDHLHPADSGYKVMGEAVSLALFK